jgi:hypothetical protein
VTPAAAPVAAVEVVAGGGAGGAVTVRSGAGAPARRAAWWRCRGRTWPARLRRAALRGRVVVPGAGRVRGAAWTGTTVVVTGGAAAGGVEAWPWRAP